MNQQHDRRLSRRILISSIIVISFLSILACGYGHAALSRDLMISGEGKVVAVGGGFTSTYMQDLTPAECSSVNVNSTAQLKDKRDEQSYWIMKAVNGMCVMVQDLRLSLSADGLTSELSDLNPGAGGYATEVTEDGETILKWDSTSTRPPRNTTTSIVSNTTATATYSWDNGMYVLINPNSAGTCTMAAKQPLSTCTSRFAYVGPDYDEDGNEVAPAYEPDLDYREAGVTYDPESRTYDAHYLVGFYYQYSAATAGSVQAKTGINPSSICPKGWKLPQDSDYSSVAKDYGISSGTASGSLDGTPTSINSWPMYMNRSGYLLKGVITSPGKAGIYVTNRSYSASVVRLWSRDGTGSITGSNATYATGSTMRCVLRMDDE